MSEEREGSGAGPQPLSSLRAWLEQTGRLLLPPLPLSGWPGADTVGARLTELETRLDALEQPLVVLLLGGTGVGKSSLLNALAREPVVEVSHARRAHTDRLQLYHHEGCDVLPIVDGFGDRITLVGHRADALRNKVVVDAPDIDSIVLEHRALVERFLPRVDLVLYVTSPEKYKDLAACELVGALKGRQYFVFVMNQIDRILPGLREELLDDFREVLRRYGFRNPKLLAVSAREREEPGALPQLDALLRRRLHAERVRAIKHSGMIAHCRGWLRELELSLGDGERLETRAERLEQAAGQLEAIAQRLRSVLAQQRAEARWRASRTLARRRPLEQGMAAGGPWALFCRLVRRVLVSRPAHGLDKPESAELRLRIESALVRADQETDAVARSVGAIGAELETESSERRAAQALASLETEARPPAAAPPGPARAVALNVLPALGIAAAAAVLARRLWRGDDVGLGLVVALLLLLAAVLFAQYGVLVAAGLWRAQREPAGTTDEESAAQRLAERPSRLARQLREAAARFRALRERETQLERWRTGGIDLPPELRHDAPA
ncbi:MAG: hypothetical protein D6776_11025 [Planctomycetota bacterium]|nr:MAG: hypothetical protein D6776_11025 [Planctomycetota bacterium]